MIGQELNIFLPLLQYIQLLSYFNLPISPQRLPSVFHILVLSGAPLLTESCFSSISVKYNKIDKKRAHKYLKIRGLEEVIFGEPNWEAGILPLNYARNSIT